MSKLGIKENEYLQGKFGNRVNFNPTELILYSHDMAAMPNLIKPLVGSTVPQAVVQPVAEDELADLI
jgi:hypothetical protein